MANALPPPGPKSLVADFGGTGVSDCAVGSTAIHTSGSKTGRADHPHPALGQDLTPSSTARRAQAGSDVRARPCSPRKPTRFPGRQKPSQFRSVSEAQRGLRTKLRPFFRVLRPKSPASLSAGRPCRRRSRRSCGPGHRPAASREPAAPSNLPKSRRRRSVRGQASMEGSRR